MGDLGAGGLGSLEVCAHGPGRVKSEFLQGLVDILAFLLTPRLSDCVTLSWAEPTCVFGGRPRLSF